MARAPHRVVPAPGWAWQCINMSSSSSAAACPAVAGWSSRRLVEATYPASARSLLRSPRDAALYFMLAVQVAAVLFVLVFTFAGSECFNEFVTLASAPRRDCVLRPLLPAEQAAVVRVETPSTTVLNSSFVTFSVSDASVITPLCALADNSTALKVTAVSADAAEVTWRGESFATIRATNLPAPYCSSARFAVVAVPRALVGGLDAWLLLEGGVVLSEVQFAQTSIEELFQLLVAADAPRDSFPLGFYELELGVADVAVRIIDVVSTTEKNGTLLDLHISNFGKYLGIVEQPRCPSTTRSVVCDAFLPDRDELPIFDSLRLRLPDLNATLTATLVAVFHDSASLGLVPKQTALQLLTVHVTQEGVPLQCRRSVCASIVGRFVTAAAISFGLVGCVTLMMRVAVPCHKTRAAAPASPGGESTRGDPPQPPLSLQLFPFGAGRFDGRPRQAAVWTMIVVEIVAVCVALWWISTGKLCLSVYATTTSNPRVGCARRLLSANEVDEIVGDPPLSARYLPRGVNAEGGRSSDWLQNCATTATGATARSGFLLATSHIARNGTLSSDGLCPLGVHIVQGPPFAPINFNVSWTVAYGLSVEFVDGNGVFHHVHNRQAPPLEGDLWRVCLARTWIIIDTTAGDSLLVSTTGDIYSMAVDADRDQVLDAWYTFAETREKQAFMPFSADALTVDAPITLGGVFEFLTSDTLDLRYVVAGLNARPTGVAHACSLASNCTAPPLRVHGFRMWLRGLTVNLTAAAVSLKRFTEPDVALASVTQYLHEPLRTCARIQIPLREGDVGMDCSQRRCANVVRRFSLAVPVGLAFVALMGLALRSINACFEPIAGIKRRSEQQLGPRLSYLSFCFPLVATRAGSGGPRPIGVILASLAQTGFIVWSIAYTAGEPGCLATYERVATPPPRLSCTERPLTGAEHAAVFPGADPISSKLAVAATDGGTLAELVLEASVDVFTGSVVSAACAAAGSSTVGSSCAPLHGKWNLEPGRLALFNVSRLSAIVDAASLDSAWWGFVGGSSAPLTVNASGTVFINPVGAVVTGGDTLRLRTTGVADATGRTPGTPGALGWNLWEVSLKAAGPLDELSAVWDAVALAPSVRLSSDGAQFEGPAMRVADVRTFCSTVTCEAPLQRLSFAVTLGMTVMGGVFYLLRWVPGFHHQPHVSSSSQRKLSIRTMIDLVDVSLTRRKSDEVDEDGEVGVAVVVSDDDEEEGGGVQE